MITKSFNCKTNEQKTEVLWSFEAACIENSNAGSQVVSAKFKDEYQLVAWAQTHKKYFETLPTEI